MKRNLILMGRYTLLMIIALAMCVGAMTLASMPDWMIRAGGVVGAGWLALRYVLWRTGR